MFATADAPTKLMQLRQAEALGVLDEHHRCVGNVHADLDDGRRDEDVTSTCAELLHDAVLVGRSHLAVQQVNSQVGEDLGGKMRRFLLGGFDFRFVALIDRRADDESLAAVGDLAADQVVRLASIGGRGEYPRLDGLASARHLVEDDDVEVSVVGEREGSRDRSGGHDQHVRVPSLAPQRHALVDAEAVLFVDDREREVGEINALLQQSVRPDDDVHASVGKPGENTLAILARHRRIQYGVGRPRFGDRFIQERNLSVLGSGGFRERVHGPDTAEKGLGAPTVLSRQDFRRSHDRRLMPGRDRTHRCEHRHRGLARAHVSLKQGAHGTRPAHRLADSVHRA